MDLQAKRFTPEPVNSRVESWDYVPVAQINNKHELMHKPNDWEIVDGQWLPILSPVVFQEGVNGYVQREGPEAIRSHYRHKGCDIIAPGDSRLGEYSEYMGTVPCINPETGATGKLWITIFDEPTVVGNDVRWERDTTEYNNFRKILVDNGVVRLNKTIAEIVVGKKEVALESMERICAERPATPKRKETLDLMRKNVADMKTSLVKLAAPVAASQRNKKFTRTIEKD